jgi:hypothetical protein
VVLFRLILHDFKNHRSQFRIAALVALFLEGIGFPAERPKFRFWGTNFAD